MTFGLTAAGFVPKRTDDIVGELNAAAQVQFGANVDLDPRRPIGQMIGILAERLSSLWALAESLHSAMSPRTASGINLDNAVALTGIVRLPATASTVPFTISGTPGTIVPIGFRVSKTGDESIQFETIHEVTVGPGGSVLADAICTVTGAFEAAAGTLVNIETPIAGVSSVTNATDADPGRDRETDSELRIRQQEYLQAPGTSTVEGIRAAVRLLNNVRQVTVIENDTNVVDGGGRPAKSFEVVVDGGDQDEIAQTIWEAKPVGIETFGTTTVSVTDSQGLAHNVKFSRPVVVPITITVTIVANTDPLEDALYPVTGDDLVAEQILAYADTLSIGKNVFINKLFSYINEVPGVVGITISAYRDADPPVSDVIAIDVDEVAEFDIARITVNS